MADKSDIGWTDATWQIITGCSIDTPGCTNCYAMDLAGTRLKNHPSRHGLTKEVNGKHVWTGEVRFNRGWLLQPLQWKKPREIFVAAHGDLFHPEVQDEWLDEIFAVMVLAHWHTFQVLTKRSSRMRAYMSDPETPTRISRHADRLSGFTLATPAPVRWPRPNIHVGVSCEDQKRADLRVPDLLATPAAKRFVSAEPLLGPIDFSSYPDRMWLRTVGSDGAAVRPGLDQIITGGESGRGARRPRPVHVDAFRSIRDQCAAAGTAFFHKQNGGWIHESQLFRARELVPANIKRHSWPDGSLSFLVGAKAAGALLDGLLHEGRP